MVDPGQWVGEAGAGRQRHPEGVVEPLHDQIALAVAIEVGVLRLPGLEAAAMVDPGLRRAEAGAGWGGSDRGAAMPVGARKPADAGVILAVELQGDRAV